MILLIELGLAVFQIEISITAKHKKERHIMEIVQFCFIYECKINSLMSFKIMNLNFRTIS